MGPSARSPGARGPVVLSRSRQLMHYNRNASKVDGLYINVGRLVGVCGRSDSSDSHLDRKKSHPPSEVGKKALAT